MTAGPPLAGRRRGVVTRALRRVLLKLLREEVEEVRRGLAAHQEALDALTADLAAQGSELSALAQGAVSQLAQLQHEQQELSAAVEALSGALGQRFEVAQRARLELQSHLETMFGQLAAEVEELRGAFFVARGEFEEVRDKRVPMLEATAGRLQEALATIQGALEELSAVRMAQLEFDSARRAADIGNLGTAVQNVQGEVERLRDERIPAAMRDLAGLQRAYDDLQGVVLGIRDQQLPLMQETLTRLQLGVSRLQELGEELRDQRLPALVGRYDALLARLHEQGEATGGLLDRLLAGEGLRIDTPPVVERELPEALRRAHLVFAEAFRGTREEVLERVSEHVNRLRAHAPVLDLGCGRGELLEALQRAGVEARGVDADPAMVAACRRRGLQVVQGDALEVLAAQPAGSLGAVTALHLFEHLPAGTWASILQAAVAALKPGGVVLVECPNPEALRVGADLFWIDPTHRAPVHRQALAFVMRALGLEVVENTLLHPFPPEQMLATPGLPAELRTVAERLDNVLSGPRDWLLVARKLPQPAA